MQSFIFKIQFTNSNSYVGLFEFYNLMENLQNLKLYFIIKDLKGRSLFKYNNKQKLYGTQSNKPYGNYFFLFKNTVLQSLKIASTTKDLFYIIDLPFDMIKNITRGILVPYCKAAAVLYILNFCAYYCYLASKSLTFCYLIHFKSTIDSTRNFKQVT